MRRILALALTATATVGGLSGCATATAVDPADSASVSAAVSPRSASWNMRCIDWVSGATPRERFASADVVVVATVRGTGRTVEDFTVYPVHRATDVQVLKGTAPAAFDVIAPSDRCEREGEPVRYLEGDPLDGASRAVLYLRDDGSTLRLITPDALDVVAEGAPLPDLSSAS